MFLSSIICLILWVILVSNKCAAFQLPMIGFKHKFRLMSTVEPSLQPQTLSIRDKIELVVDKLIALDKPQLTLDDIDPTLLHDNAHFLAKPGLFEEIMKERALAPMEHKERNKLEAIQDVLTNYISIERKNRAKLKLKYLLDCLIADKLEYGIDMLVER